MSTISNIDNQIVSLIKDLNNKKYDDVIKKAFLLIKADNEFSVLYNLVGVAYSFKEDNINSIKAYEKAIQIDPNNEEIYRNLGKAYIKLKKFDQAQNSFKKSIELRGKNFDAYFGLGLVCLENKKYFDCLEFFNKAIEYNNKFYQAYYNTGVVNSILGNNLEAEKNYKKAIEINNSYIQALNNLGSIYVKTKNIDIAIECFKKCLEINPNYINAITNLGVALLERKEFSNALIYLNKAIKIRPDHRKAIAQKLFIKRKICDWSDKELDKYYLKIINNSDEEITPWQLLSLDDDASIELQRAKNYAKQFINLSNNTKISYKNKKIKIGYFTSDFHYHAGMMNMEGLFKYANKDKFEIYGFDYGKNNNDKTHQRIKKYFDKFFYVFDYTDKQIADLAIENKIDIGIHRNGFSQNSRTKIFSYKPCSIQINYLGYPGTTGLDYLDYIIADKIVIPKKHYNYYSEKIIFMPNSYYPTYNERIVSKKKFKRSELGIPDKFFVLCCFNNSYKISSSEFSIWMKVMQIHKNTCLILLIKEIETQHNLLNEAKKFGIGEDRIFFFDFIDIEKHLSRHTLANLYLDTFNYNGHTSAVDSLYMGLPVITKIGKSFTSRVCASLLNAHGLSELITENENDYFKLINKLISNKEYYRKIILKTNLLKKSSNLFNTKNYVKDFEDRIEKALKNKITDNIIKII